MDLLVVPVEDEVAAAHDGVAEDLLVLGDAEADVAEAGVAVVAAVEDEVGDGDAEDEGRVAAVGELAEAKVDGGGGGAHGAGGEEEALVVHGGVEVGEDGLGEAGVEAGEGGAAVEEDAVGAVGDHVAYAAGAGDADGGEVDGEAGGIGLAFLLGIDLHFLC